jgi:type IV secretory pathway TraG/TraD family ATPase VirD4
MTNDEIRTMKIDRALLVCGHYRPIMAKLKPYYKVSRYIEYSSIDVPMEPATVPAEAIPVLPLKSSKQEEHA